jgi:hypothetical protein
MGDADVPEVHASGQGGKAGFVMAEKEYRLLRGGVSQREGDSWKEYDEGDLIALSKEAAEHLAAEGFIEGEAKPAKRKAAEK